MTCITLRLKVEINLHLIIIFFIRINNHIKSNCMDAYAHEKNKSQLHPIEETINNNNKLCPFIDWYMLISMWWESIAGLNFKWALVDGADVFDHVWLNCILSWLGVNFVDNNPRNILMSWLQCISNFSHLSFVLPSLLWSWAAVDLVPVQSVLSGAFLSLSHEISCLSLKADQEGKGLWLIVVGVKFKGTCFNEVSLAFSGSVLAGEAPVISAILCSSCISVGEKLEVTYFPEILSKRCFTLAWAAAFKDLCINCWQYGQRDS